MSISILTGGYISSGGSGGTVIPQGPATIIAGPTPEDVREFLPEVASFSEQSYVPDSLDAVDNDDIPVAVGSSYDDIKPRPVISIAFVPKPISSSGG